MKSKFFFVAPLLTMAVLVGCARDRNADDYRKEKVVEELARLNAISGTYSGTLVSRTTGEPIGNLTLHLQASVVASTSPDSTKSEERPFLKSRATVYAAKSLSVSFEEASSFDPDTGSLKSQTHLQKADGSNYEIELSGILNGDRLKGSLEAFGYPEDGADFVVMRNAPLPQELPPEKSLHALEYYLDESSTSSTYPLRLSLNANPLTREEEFLELFLPIRNMRGTFSFADVDVVFNHLRWDQKSSSLIGTAILGNESLEVLLKCQASGNSRWLCEYSSNVSETIHTVQFVAVSEAEFLKPPLNPPLSESRNFRGETTLPLVGKKSLNLSVSYKTLNEEEKSREFFLNVKIVRVALDFSRDAQVVFDNALWYFETGRITARTSLNVKGQPLDIVLECSGPRGLSALTSPWNCSYTTSAKSQPQKITLAPLPQEHSPQPPQDALVQFQAEGPVTLPYSTSRSLHLSLNSRQQTQEEQLAEYFRSIKTVRAALTLSSNVQLVFENTEWNLETGALRGQTTLFVGGQNTEVVLECFHLVPSQLSQPWNCQYTSSLKQSPVMMKLNPTSTSRPRPSPDIRVEMFSSGNVRLPSGENRRVQLNLLSREQTRDEQIKDYFQYIRNLRATLVFSRNVQIVFSDAEWNRETGTLRGHTQVPIAGENVDFSLDCTGVQPQRSWSCQYRTSLRSAPVSLTLSPRSHAETPSSPPSGSKESYVSGTASVPYWGQRPVFLAWNRHTSTREQELQDYFKAIHSIRVSLVFSPHIQVAFENVEWNKDEGTLRGSATLALSLEEENQNVAIYLDCRNVQLGQTSTLQWACQYTTGLSDRPVELQFSRAERTRPAFPPSLPTFEYSYQGHYVTPEGKVSNVPIHFVSKQPTKAQEYFEFFRFQRFARVTLNFDRDVTIVFESARWFRETQTLIAQTRYLQFGQQVDLTLECRETGINARQIPSWSCNYTSSIRGLVANIELTPVE